MCSTGDKAVMTIHKKIKIEVHGVSIYFWCVCPRLDRIKAYTNELLVEVLIRWYLQVGVCVGCILNCIGVGGGVCV